MSQERARRQLVLATARFVIVLLLIATSGTAMKHNSPVVAIVVMVLAGLVTILWRLPSSRRRT